MVVSFLRSSLLVSAGVLAGMSALLSQPGSIDPTFDPGSGVSKNGTAAVNAIAVQPDGKILVGGDFTTVNGIARSGIARLNANGSVDATFQPSPGANDQVLTLELQSDGKVLIGGSFTNVNGVARNAVARLNSDGTLDTSFDPGAGPNFDVNTLAPQSDGKVLIGGGFDMVSTNARSGLARLNSNGSIDQGFAPNLGLNAFVDTVVIQGGKPLIGGSFQVGGGPLTDQVLRLNADGTADPTFQAVNTDAEILALLLQPDSKPVAVGSFMNANGKSRNRIARLNVDGSVDSTFDPGAGPNGDILAGVVQPDGKIVIGGNFGDVDASPKNGVARLNGDGSLDPVYNAGSGVEGSVQALAIQSDGGVLVGGFISKVDGVAREGIARLQGDIPLVELTAPRWKPAGTFSVSVATVTGKNYVLEYVNNPGESWTLLPPLAGDGTVKTLTDTSATGPHRFYRVLVQ
jgi:uncharacterized delta-60 repeat protein